MNRILLLLASVAVVVLASIPDILGFAAATDAQVYTGRNLLLIDDKAAYLALIEEARDGAFLFHNLFTGEEHRAVFVAPLWWTLGVVARVTSLSAPAVFAFARALAGVIFLYVLGTQILSRFLGPSPRRLWAAWAFVALSSGFGFIWLFFFLENILRPDTLPAAADLWIAEMTTFRSLTHSPLFILSQLAIALVVVLFLASERGRRAASWGMIALFFLLTLHHPYDFFVVMGVLSIYVVTTHWWKRADYPPIMSRVARLATLGAAGFIPIALQFIAMAHETAFSGWIMQNVTWSPPLWMIALGYGMLLPLALIGGRAVWERGKAHDILLVVWAVAGFILVFTPFPYQRRFLNGLHIPIAILAAEGFVILWRNRAQGRLRRVVVAVVLIPVLFGTPPILMTTVVRREAHPTEQTHTLRGFVQATRWVRTHTPPDALFLVLPLRDANIFPALAVRRVWFGHGHQTVNAKQKKEHLFSVLRASANDRVLEFFLRNEQIDYLVAASDAAERDAVTLSLDGTSFLTPVFSEEGTVVYRVDR